MRQVLLYDPKRRPAEWTALIQAEEYCVFLSEAASGVPLAVDGSPLDSASENFCLIFGSLADAEEYCKAAIERVPSMQCEVFDSAGRMNPALRVFVSPAFAHTIDSETGAQRLIRFGFVALALSLPLFWWGWKSTADGSWLWVVLGINAVVMGLRFIQWGHGVKERLRHSAGAQEILNRRSAKQGS